MTPAWPSGNTLTSDDGTRFLVASVTVGGSLPGVFADTSDGLSGRSDFEQMFEEIRGEGESGRWLVWLLGATGAGYSVGQITEYLDENEPFTDLSPPTISGVPIVIDSDGDMVEPRLPSDWPYKGRNILVGLQEDEDLDLEDNWAVLVIGMVNAGYSEAQITDAVRWNGVGLCTTQGGSSDGEASFTPCYVDRQKDGDEVVAELVPPAETTPFSPAEIVIDDVIPNWPLTNAAKQSSPATSGQLKSGKAVSLTLTPYLPNPDTTLKITSHEVTMEIEPAADTTASLHSITGRWEIKLVETETDLSENRSHDKGETHVLEGEFYSDHPTSLDNLKLATEYTWTAYTPTGTIKERFGDTTERSFTGELDEDLEGDGFFGSIGPTQVNCDTFPGVE